MTCVSVLPSFICLPTQETQKTRVRSLGQEDPLEKKMATAPVFLPGGSHGQRSLAGYSPRGHKESDRTEHACMWYSIVWIDCISFFFLFFLAMWHNLRDLSSPTRDWTPSSAGKCGVLTTRLPKKFLDNIYFIALPVTWHLGCVHSSAIVSNVAMNTCVDTFLFLVGICLGPKLWGCIVGNSERDGSTRPPDLPLEKPVCRSGSKS